MMLISGRFRGLLNMDWSCLTGILIWNVAMCWWGITLNNCLQFISCHSCVQGRYDMILSTESSFVVYYF